MKVLNIGCGLDKYAEKRLDTKLSREWDVVGLDKLKLKDVDVIHDLNDLPLPFKDGEFDMVYSAHVIEHINDVDALIIEIHRILKSNGIFKAVVPHHTNPCAYSHYHKTCWSMTSFDHIESVRTVSNLTGLFKPTKKIKLIRPFGWFEAIANRFPNFYEWRLTWLIPAIEVHFELKVVK